MTKKQDNMIRDHLINDYLKAGVFSKQEATMGVDPAWGPGEEPYFHNMRPREHSFKMNFEVDKDVYEQFMGNVDKPAYPYKIYDLLKFEVYDPKTRTMTIDEWAMSAEGFDE